MKKVINFFNLKGPFGGPLGELVGYNVAIVELYEEYLKFTQRSLPNSLSASSWKLCDPRKRNLSV